MNQTSAYVALIDDMRALLDSFVASQLRDDQIASLRRSIDSMRAITEESVVPEGERSYGAWNPDRKERTQCMLPPIQHLSVTSVEYRGRVVIGEFHNGFGSAAHGGVLGLLFDEALGTLAIADNRPTARTAYLNINYRNITPLNRELEIRGRVERIDGRKRFISGGVYDGDTLCADAEALFVELKQPEEA